MDLVSYQRCTRNGPMTEVNVTSSDGKTVYVCLVTDPNDPSEVVCDCRAFKYSPDGTCKHQELAIAGLCHWKTGADEEQTSSQRRNKICPRCGGETEWTMDYQ